MHAFLPGFEASAVIWDAEGNRLIASKLIVKRASSRSRLIELDPNLALARRHAEGDVAAVALAVAIQHPERVVAGHVVARQPIQPDGIFVVEFAERPRTGCTRDAAQAVGDLQVLPILLQDDEVAALRLSPIDAAVDEQQLQLDFGAAVRAEAWAAGDAPLAAVPADARAWIGRGRRSRRRGGLWRRLGRSGSRDSGRTRRRCWRGGRRRQSWAGRRGGRYCRGSRATGVAATTAAAAGVGDGATVAGAAVRNSSETVATLTGVKVGRGVRVGVGVAADLSPAHALSVNATSIRLVVASATSAGHLRGLLRIGFCINRSFPGVMPPSRTTPRPAGPRPSCACGDLRRPRRRQRRPS